MKGTSQWCVSEWKKYINHRNYQRVVTDVWGIANLFYSEKNTEWIEALRSVEKKIDESSDRMIMPHIKKYMKDFLNVAIQSINGQCSKLQLANEKNRTLKLLAIAYCS